MIFLEIGAPSTSDQVSLVLLFTAGIIGSLVLLLHLDVWISMGTYIFYYPDVSYIPL